MTESSIWFLSSQIHPAQGALDSIKHATPQPSTASSSPSGCLPTPGRSGSNVVARQELLGHAVQIKDCSSSEAAPPPRTLNLQSRADDATHGAGQVRSQKPRATRHRRREQEGGRVRKGTHRGWREAGTGRPRRRRRSCSRRPPYRSWDTVTRSS
jgi:hypothetical protein